MLRRRPNPLFDTLESRRLLSSAPFTPIQTIITHSTPTYASVVTSGTVWLSDDRTGDSIARTKTGTLVIKGTAGSDALTVATSGTSANVNFDGHKYIIFNVKRVLVEANGGDDHVDVSAFTRPSTVVGGSGDDVLVGARATNLLGGAGNDKLVATATSDVITLPIGGQTSMQYSDVRPSVLSGGAGNDTLVAQGADSVTGGSGKDLFAGSTNSPAEIDGNSSAQQIEILLRNKQGLVTSGIELFSLTVSN